MIPDAKVNNRFLYGIRLSDPRNLAGNLDSPQTVVFITSIIDEIASVST